MLVIWKESLPPITAFNALHKDHSGRMISSDTGCDVKIVRIRLLTSLDELLHLF